MDDLLSLVAELRVEVERLRSIRDIEKDIDWWSCTHSSLRQMHPLSTSQEAIDPLLSHHQAEGRDLGDEGE